MKTYDNTVSFLQPDFDKVDKISVEILSAHSNFLTDKLTEFITSKSKKIRSAFIFLLLKIFTGTISEKQYKTAAIIEIIHNATLIHDDILDNADKRRGNKSLNVLFGDKTAVIAGDYLLSIGLSEIADFKNPEITHLFALVLTDICLGEINQIEEKHKVSSIKCYLEKSRKKTAELFKAGIITALLTENLTQFVGTAELLAVSFGTAFQIRDDLINITGTKHQKPVLNDIKDGIYTAPVIYFLEENKNQKIDEHFIENLKNSAAITKTKELLAEQIKKSLDLIKDFNDNRCKTAFTELCNYLLTDGE